jgi:flagellar motor switch protein FliM
MNTNQQVARIRKLAAIASHGGRSRVLDHRLLRQLHTQYGAVARDFGEQLSKLLRTTVEVRLADVDPMDYSGFLCNLAASTCFHVLRAEPSQERLMLDIELPILHPMIDRLLGGAIAEVPPSGRPMTEIEWNLSARIVRAFIDECQNTSQGAFDAKLCMHETAGDPRPMRILPDDEPVVVLTFELSLGGLHGRMRYCVPRRIFGLTNPAPTQNTPTETSAVIQVTLAESPIDAQSLAGLRVGDIIATETPADSPVVVSIDGAKRFLGKPGVYQGQKAVRLTKTTDDSTADPK